MTTPSVTLRSLKNEETGIDISVPHFEEEEAPLGGTSILYEISVLTNLDLFKTSLHKSEDIVHFSVFKAYREIEELSSKIKKKYPKISLPSVSKSSLVEKSANAEKLENLNLFMEAVAKNRDICCSSIFTQFIGLSPQRISALKKINVTEELPDDNSDIFLKIKKNDNTENEHSPVETAVHNQSSNDLFEAKLKEKCPVNIMPSSKNDKSSAGLFDEFDDDNLFSCKAPEKNTTPPKQEEKKLTGSNVQQVSPTKKAAKVQTRPENIDDSQIIIKDRKQGDVSLFEEQEFGDYITKEEEALFLVTPNVNDGKKNTLLFLSHEMPSSETDSSLNDNLEDLLNLEPLPDSPTVNKKRTERLVERFEEESAPVSATASEDISESKPGEPVPSKPVPMPRKKSVGKIEDDVPKPEVLPRKVFLSKPQVPAKRIPPEIPAKPSISHLVDAKPAPPPKPKPPPLKPKPKSEKTPIESKDAKDLDVANANKPEEKTGNLNSVSDLANDLNKLDILKYIEQEEKTLEAEANLFD